MTKLLTDKSARKYFESLYKPVADRTWYRIKSIFDSKFPLDKENLEFVAKLKVLNPGVNTGILKTVAELKRLQKFKNSSFTGKEIQDYFTIELSLIVNQSTLSRWFKPLGGFRKDKSYSFAILYPVFVSALILMNKKKNEKIKMLK